MPSRISIRPPTTSAWRRSAPGLTDNFRRARAVQSIHDLDTRLRMIDQFPDYAQVISLPMPTLETVAKGMRGLRLELARIGNDGLASWSPSTQAVSGFRRAGAAVRSPAGAAEAERPSRSSARSACRSIPTRRQAARSPRVRAVLPRHEQDQQRSGCIPRASRGGSGLPRREEITLRDLVDLRWPYETSVAMARLVFSKTLDKYPQPQDHRPPPGAMVPYFEGRVGPGWGPARQATT